MTAEIFFKELQRLILSQPKLYTHTLDSENSEYGDQLYFCKNMINSFDTLNSADCVYVFDCQNLANCVDCDYTYDSQLCYDCVSCRTCFNSHHLDDCHNVRDSAYSYRCFDCQNVFGCVNLNSKSFCIFNRQLTEEQYKQELQKLQNVPAEKIIQVVEELKKKYPKTQTHETNTENSPYGDYLYNSKNCYMCFDSAACENCGYLYDSGNQKDCYDSTFSGDSELSYESIDSTHLFNCSFCIWSGHSSDSNYLIACGNVKNCLGCVNIAQKEYCILNRQYTKEEYEVKSKQILEELKSKNLGWAGLIF